MAAMNPKHYKTDKLQTNSLRMVIVVVLFIAVMAFLTVTLTTQDTAWFTTGFYERPVKVVVYNGGLKTEYSLGKDGFADLAEGVRLALNSGVQRPSGLGLSQGSLEDAYNMYVSVEATFPYPVKLHSWFNTGNPTRALFLITGRHADRNVVFLGDNISYMAGAPVLNSVQPLLDVMNKLGYPIN